MPESSDSFAELVETASSVGVFDAYQYTSIELRNTDVPSNIRMLLRRKPAEELGSAVHDQYTLVLALESAANVHIDTSVTRVSPGEALLIFPGQVHKYSSEGEADVFWMFICFTLQGGSGYQSLRATPIRISDCLAADFSSLLNLQFQRNGEEKRHSVHSERCAALRLALILEQMHGLRLQALSALAPGQTSTPTLDSSHPLIRQIIDYLSEHLADPVAIDDIATAFRLSNGHLRNEFHRLAGFGLGQFIRYMKMNHACRLMDTTELSLADISDRCGYASIFSFSRAFKKEKGLPPSEYRSGYQRVR
jgi:AraC-like DNA-binding protein/quercetin dioxygenase-like cupin family protein